MLLRRMVSSLSPDTIVVVHDVPRTIFRAVTAKGMELGHLEYRLVENPKKKSVDFYHTFTRPEAQGKGVAGKLVEAGLKWAVDEKMDIIASCSYVAAYMKKNPKYHSSL